VAKDAARAFAALAGYLRGHDVFRLEAMRFAICNPTASLYNNRTQLHAAIEFACLDVIGTEARQCPVHDFLGGKLRDEVGFASYLFFRYNDPDQGRARCAPPEQLVAHGRGVAARAWLSGAQAQGRRLSARLRARVLSARSPRRFPTIATATIPTARSRLPTRSISAAASRSSPNDYYEDPSGGCRSSRGLKEFVSIPTATNTVVVDFAQLAANVEMRAVDVVLLDTTFWGGIRPLHQGGRRLRDDGESASPSTARGELGIQLATMLHLGAVLPNIGYAGRRALPSPDRRRDRRREDDVPQRRDRRSRGNGLGIALDRDKLAATTSSSWSSAAIRTIGTPAGRGGTRPCRITIGPTRRIRPRQRSQRAPQATDVKRKRRAS
jgi:glucarate dehydratase